MFNSITVGAMPLSRSKRTTVRPVGPNPITTARWAGSPVRGVPGAFMSEGIADSRFKSADRRGRSLRQRSMGRIVRYARGLRMIEAIDVATSAFVASVGRA